MNARAKKIILLLLAAVLLAGSGQLEKSLNNDRAQLGLTISEPLQNAPPMLAFTTVALGGFRGLISNYLWIRANDLQQDDKFFEAAQLADWITDLEPHFAQVWAFQAWNMAWNISVKFKENEPGIYSDRWRWVERGIELLRDRGLRYNPDDILLYQQLGWIFQSKMGQNLDDANLYYKQQWAEEMTPFFGPNGTNFENLIHPQTAAERTNALVLRQKYKIDPVFAQKVDEEYGPLDWRLPEAHAIYWAALGLEKAKENPGKVKQDDLIELRRIIYQSTLQAFHHGRIIANPFTRGVELAPNLDLVSRANDTYLQMYDEEKDQGQKNGIMNARRYFLMDAIYFLYENDRIADAQKWFDYLAKNYPDKPILDKDPKSFPKNLTLDDYVFGRVQEDVGETSLERITSAVQGMLFHAYLDLAIGQDDRSAGYQLLAQKIYTRYQKDWGVKNPRVKMPRYADLRQEVLDQLLDPKQGLPFAARAVIRTQLGMPPEKSVASANGSTNSMAPAILSDTNAPATNSIGR
ncbi:MAG TPA: hypothetical protein VMD57_01630 [Candidatus Baltobacteraceae bacterium]|nr:hypothetical protein [Candidatus Baltobacteraceae bacterium]